MIRTNKLKNDSIRNIYPKAPDLMTFWVQFLDPQNRLLLDRFRKFLEELIEDFSGRNFHLFIFKKLRKRFSFCNTAFFMVFLRKVKKFKELLSVKSCGSTEGLEAFFTYLKVDTLRGLPCYCCLKFRIPKYVTSPYSYFDRLNIFSGGENVKNVEIVVYVS